MKLSIITVCLNSEKTIADTINSVNSQTYKNIEHIFIDGGSQDSTLKIIKKNPNKNKKIFIKKKSNIYQAMNEGIKKSNGKFIQILNSDDILNSKNTIKETIETIKRYPKLKMFFGNVVYFKQNNFQKIRRFYQADKKKISNLINGEMPPHPASFVNKDVYKKYGLYNEKLKIAADFEFFYRVISLRKIDYKILNTNIVRMRTGGASDKHIKSYFITTKEVLKSVKNEKNIVNTIKILLRGYLKLKELFFFNEQKLNKNFELFDYLFQKEEYEKKTFKILKNINLLNMKKNFILSGMNLAFLGYYSKKNLYPNKHLFHWPDGIFTKNIIDIEKIPGRDIVNKITIPNYIKKIIIIGNISNKSKKFLQKKFKINLKHLQLPYGSINELRKKNIKLNRNELAFITLPTPKQEQLSYHLSKKNKHFKIICIGGSIAIASGEESQVPNFLKNYEYIWRLKNDFRRRIVRVIGSLIYYIKGKYINNIYNQTIFKLIEK